MGGRRPVGDGGNQRAFSLGETDSIGDILGDRLDLHAEIAVIDRTVLLQLGNDHLCFGGRNGEADADAAAVWRVDGGIDADDIAITIDQRTTGIAMPSRST